MRVVRIGGPIALAVIGLILALAVSNAIDGVNLSLIGWILFGAAAVWLLLELVLNRPRTRVTEIRDVQDRGQAVHREERRDI
ncbi:MAG: DUF6458 family protein [Propionibacteriaceae bacterium]|nr:DUF6458 family protein [Propionibacteriaceae bacterium]